MSLKATVEVQPGKRIFELGRWWTQGQRFETTPRRARELGSGVRVVEEPKPEPPVEPKPRQQRRKLDRLQTREVGQDRLAEEGLDRQG